MENNARIETILRLLSESYPNATIALHYGSAWELLVAVILSAQCTDVMVNSVTATLFRKYPTLTSYLKATREEFEQDIRKTGFYRAKAAHILKTAALIDSRFHGVVPNTMEDLLTLPGVARKTANVVLGNAYGIVEGIAVDTHVLRLSQRLRLVDPTLVGGKAAVYVDPEKGRRLDYKKDASPEKIERFLMGVLPKNRWMDITYQLIDHGRAVCKAQRPQCSHCPLSDYCPASRASGT